MRRLGLVLCGVAFVVTGCGGSGSDSSNAPAKLDELPQIMRDRGFKCSTDSEAPDFYNAYEGIPHRNLDCNKGGDSGPTARFFIWDDGVAQEAFYSNAVDQFCGSDQSPTYVVGDGWGATVTTSNAAKDATIIDLDGMSEITDVVGGKVISPIC